MINARSISRLAKIDWDFAGSFSESPFSAIHWHPARFASQLPASLIGLLSAPGDTVLDPFVGSGTTLVEAQRLGRRSVGIDISPISCLIARAKTLMTPAHKIGEAATAMSQDAIAAIGVQRRLSRQSGPSAQIPDTVQAQKWYTPRVLRDLGELWAHVATYRGLKRILGDAAFSAILLTVCRETRHWGYVCDNSTPKGSHEGHVLDEFCQTLKRLANAYAQRDADVIARSGSMEMLKEAQVVCGSASELLLSLPLSSVDLVITSPPYFGVCDYVKAQRLSMEWFGSEIEPLRLREIGARSKRHRALAREAYLDDMTKIFAELKRVLRKNGQIAVIVGESKDREAVLDDLRNCLLSVGLQLHLDLNRRVSSQRRQAPSIRGEHIFVLSA